MGSASQNGRTRTVLVTGASTGIGEACVLHLDGAGLHVVAAVRREEDAARLRDQASSRLTTVLLDVTDTAAIDRVVAEIGARGGLDGLVNNAGISGGDPLEFTDLATIRRMLEVNLLGAIATTQRALPLLRPTRGRIVFIGSISGRNPVPFTAPYAASKAALGAVCDCLRVELAPWGIEVALVEPGSVATPIWDKGIRDFDRRREAYPPQVSALYGGVFDALRSVTLRTARAGIPPQRVAQVVEHALTAPRPRTRYLVGTDARVQALLRRLPDRTRDRIVTRYLGLRSRTAPAGVAEGAMPHGVA